MPCFIPSLLLVLGRGESYMIGGGQAVVDESHWRDNTRKRELSVDLEEASA